MLSTQHPYKDTSTRMYVYPYRVHEHVCMNQCVSAWVCCYHMQNSFTHVCAHKEVPFVFHQTLLTFYHHRETSLNGPCPHALQHRLSV